MVEENNQIIQHPKTSLTMKPNLKCSNTNKNKNFVFAMPSSMFQSVPKFVYFHRKEFRRKGEIDGFLKYSLCV